MVIATVLPVNSCCGQEAKAQQRYTVRIPSAVQVSEVNSSSINKSSRDIRILASGTMAIGLSSISPTEQPLAGQITAFILRDGQSTIVRMCTTDSTTSLSSKNESGLIRYEIPRGQQAVLTVSSL